jgi:SAM-dependent methyltransferase
MTNRSLEHTAQPVHTYVLDAESAIEQARLLDLDTLLNQAMGGPLSEQGEEALQRVHDVLDIACGPGGWVQCVARLYPHMQVTGIDLSPTAIAYAQALAGVMRLPNTHFMVMDATVPLAFPDACFDLVNARLLRPGGVLRLTEGEWGIVTAAAPATARLFGLGLDALHRAGRSCSPDGRYSAITPMLRRFLRQAGFGDLQCRAYALDHSFGTQAHRGFCENYRLLFKLGQPFLLQQGLAAQEELDALYEQALGEMPAEDFGAILYLLTVWGSKP